ncbi:MAG TPA: tetratricopeptide repeat protein [Candidatus Binataceae bacterium]|nr:tetratricopeptide repeat protein [Candidatus Binataceae bacterium]
MRTRSSLKVLPLMLALALAWPRPGRCGTSTPAAVTAAPPPSSIDAGTDTGSAIRAHELVAAAINMTDSAQAVKLLWQATDIDPTLEEPYMYLALYYDSRSQFDQVVQVYQKLLKFQPKQAVAYFNIGEAYMSLTPARFEQALPYYRKAFELDPSNSSAALRIGEIYAQQNNRAEALRFLRLASADSKNPTVAAEADRIMHEMGPS